MNVYHLVKRIRMSSKVGHIQGGDTSLYRILLSHPRTNILTKNFYCSIMLLL